MFKTDKKSLEKLSFRFNEQDIARLNYLFQIIKDEDMSTLSPDEIRDIEGGLAKIGEMKMNSRLYAFHISDSYCSRCGDGSDGEGVEIWKRQGDRLQDYISVSHRDYVLGADRVAQMLADRKEMKVYTGPMPYNGNFLNLMQERDPEDSLTTSALDRDDIIEFRERGIEVITLDSLI